MKDAIEIIPLKGLPLIGKGDNLAELIVACIESWNLELTEEDILVIAHTVVSKSEGRTIKADSIQPSTKAYEIAKRNDFDPIQVELAIRESKVIIRQDRALITEMQDGHICNFSGVDHSNAPVDSYVLLPKNSDGSAQKIHDDIHRLTKKRIPVIISDTEGRPWRKGAINIAIGCAGINAFKHNKGKKDLYDRFLQHSLVCQVDEIASAAELVMGQAGEGMPVVIVRGYDFEEGAEKASDIHRTARENLFR